MDIPAIIILVSFVIWISLFLSLKFFKISKIHFRTILFWSFLGIWAAVTAFGEFVYGWAGNATCSNYLGCVEGFWGYDAFEHLYFGILSAILFIWICEHYPKYCVLFFERWKTVLVVLALVAFVGVLWEILEFTHDAVRTDIFHQSLRNVSLHINLLDQPTNFDTMGDLSAGLGGAVIGLLLCL